LIVRVFPVLRVPLVAVGGVCCGGILCMVRADIFLNLELQEYMQFVAIAANSTIFIIASGSGWVRRWIYTVLYLYMYNVT